MKVILRRDWFTPVGLFRKGNPHDRHTAANIPNDMRPLLPSDAIIVDDAPQPTAEEPAVVDAVNPGRELDMDRAQGMPSQGEVKPNQVVFDGPEAPPIKRPRGRPRKVVAE